MVYNLKAILEKYPREKNENTKLAVLTSGGDSQGMNASIRAVVRIAIQLGMTVYLVKEGYYGLIVGENYIVKANWHDVSSILSVGGTIIGTKRCMEFMTREGRLKATKNMVTLGISNLVVIGGDGSLTGANLFREEWQSYIDELLKKGEINQANIKTVNHLNLVGIVGSIDNDFSGTDMTVGADSALHRILEAIDSIVSTASSHQRTFIMEIMGRNCGYLAIKSALMCEADYLFIREWPQKSNWPEQLCENVLRARKYGKRLNIIIVSEGAVSDNGEVISSEMVKKVLVDQLQQDARITVLGHVQRGGSPSAFDRVLASRMGAHAVLSLLEATHESEPKVVCLKANVIVTSSLVECVKNTSEVAEAISKKDFDRALKLRGPNFLQNLETYKHMMNKEIISNIDGKITLILNIGGSSNGINALTYSIVRATIASNNRVLAAKFGIEGFIQGEVIELFWANVIGWLNKGGVKLGITRTIPDTQMLEQMAQQMKNLNINACVISGGLEALKTGIIMNDFRKKYEEFCIPIIVVPVTYSNNVPGTDFSLGADTALNQVVKLCDIIRQSAEGHRPRVFVVEILGGLCGYLTSMTALACGADASYIHEEEFNFIDLMECLYRMAEKFETKQITRGLVLRSEKANENYTTGFIKKLFTEEGKDLFTTRASILGSIATGGVPSPFDRSFALKEGQMAVEWIQNIQNQCPSMVKSPSSAVLLGLIKNDYKFTNLEDLKPLENETQHIMETNLDSY
ncbi:ATP-dependent 6-phosphofructokinase,ATP-dependent 6-phosphofructokinase, eukaryotic- [Cinara cedri]|uniref:6-phosphofructokinase n=1 Tax=Cinara cedri TaxID=506608 RepID=A0A5E4M7F0_9HEMI|nr:ATP-dependent 6-phosphofructokinase,ATP-dependent 6-phosphofructokinase, eukaryotic- [Cinara cedri]